jgi:opacity protein-like surface antigen
MLLKLSLKLALFSLILCTSSSAFSQIASAASQRRYPIAVGVGLSDFSLDWGQDSRMEGITAWVDTGIPFAPRVLSGFGIEVEARDININRPSSISRMRQDTLAVGPTYTLRHYRRFQPYAKYLFGIASIDFPQSPSASRQYTHDTRTLYAPGGGAQYRVFNSLWVRGDYEYQFWPELFGAHSLNPNGFTIGAMYDFDRRR